jgi:antitoxin MazE
MKTTITPWGNSLAIRIPKPFAVQSGMMEGAEVTLTLKNNCIVISKAQKNLESLLAQINPENLHTETNTGEAIGNEPW